MLTLKAPSLRAQSHTVRNPCYMERPQMITLADRPQSLDSSHGLAPDIPGQKPTEDPSLNQMSLPALH